MDQANCRRCVRLTLIGLNAVITLFGLAILIWSAANVKANTVTDGKTGVILGLLVSVLSIIGIFGVYNKNVCLLVTYAIVLGVLMFASLALALLFNLANSNISLIKNSMNSSMYQYYNDKRSKQEWDEVQKMHMCCGLEAPSDWKNVPGYLHEEPKSCGDKPSNRKGCWGSLEKSLQMVFTISKGIFTLLAAASFMGVVCACYVTYSPGQDVSGTSRHFHTGSSSVCQN